MDLDILFLFGLIFLPLAFVAFVAAWADRRPPWAALIMLIIGFVLLAWAHLGHPDGGYTLSEVPDLLFDVMGRYSSR